MFDFKSIYEARDVPDAIAALLERPNACIIAGGTDVTVKMREGGFRDRDLVSIQGLSELKKITLDEDKNIHIGPLATFREIEDNALLQEHIPYFCDAVGTVGGPQVRAMATVGGNVSNGVTTADAPPTLFALDTQVEISGPDGKRFLPIEKYYIRPEVMDLAPGELLTDIIIPYHGYSGFAGYYIKYAVREAMDIALLGCAVVCRFSENNRRVEDIRIAFGAAAPLPVRAYTAEAYAKGKRLSAEMLRETGRQALADVSPITCRRATRDFRLHLVEVLPARVIRKIMDDAGAALPKEGAEC